MVPCQPRQLVIFSLPFAALVAFFWFKRRRSSSHSDPGGTLDQIKPVDKLATTNVSKDKVNNICVKDVEVLESTKTVTKQITAPVKEVEDKLIKITYSGNRNTRSIVDTSVENVVEEPAIEKKEFIKSIPEVGHQSIISNGAAVFNFENKSELEESEEKLTSPDFELKSVFHSTVIEDEDSIKTEQICSLIEDNAINGKLQSYKTDIDHCKEEYLLLDKKETNDSSCVDKEDLDTTLTCIRLEEETVDLSLEEENTVENIALEQSFHIGELVEKTAFVGTTTDELLHLGQHNLCGKELSDSDSVEKLENLSADTGVGSQDLSLGEDFQPDMAQGQSAEKSDNNTAGLEQKLASLGLDTQQAAAAQRAERDSANHSPAEVMLNSPAISTFSDAHSEGSSDSGKGCSDVVTPPSRTPAGGSSVAGDQVPSIYEFVLPQVIVGRLIGRHGAFLHDIRAKTHTNIFIKRHPETSSLKICAIEGTQADIDAALKMIRQKFPLRRFPDLTLERVSFVKNSSLPINPENLQLHLVEGVNNDVLVSYMVTAGHVFLQLPMHMSYHNLYRMACIMNTVYSTEESPPLPDPQPDVVCVAPAAGGWYRAQILSVDEEAHTSDVRFLDYGGFLTVDNSLLRQIRGDFMLLPFQAIECVMANIIPAGGKEEWSEAANQFVQSITSQQILQAQVYDYTDTGLPLVYLYFTQFYQSSTDPSGLETRVVLLNEELVSHGYADLIEGAVPEDGQIATTESS